MTISPQQAILNGIHVPSTTLRRWLDIRCVHFSNGQRERIAQAYTVCGWLTTIGGLLPFCQALHETGHFTSARWRQSNNPAGLGSTDDGAWGHTFDTIEAGILAQFCHLLCYGSKPGVYLIDRLAALSPRHDAMVKAYGRGVAPLWIDLSGRWNSPKTPYRYTHPESYGMKIIALADKVMG